MPYLYSYSILLSLLCLKCPCSTFFLAHWIISLPHHTHILHASRVSVLTLSCSWALHTLGLHPSYVSPSPRPLSTDQVHHPTSISLHVPPVRHLVLSLHYLLPLKPTASSTLPPGTMNISVSFSHTTSLPSLQHCDFDNSGVEFILPVLWMKRQVQRNPVQLESDLP